MQLPAALTDVLRKAQRITALTGAGISADSGIPTFREAQTGLWAQYDPAELATRNAFQKNPELVWEWYTWRRSLIAGAVPNHGHDALAQIERLTPGFKLITQNVDGLHQKAGSAQVIELHGNIFHHRCFKEDKPVETIATGAAGIPTCPDCGGFLRPDVVWFNEPLPFAALAAAFDAAQKADVFLSIGTSSIVQPAASLPLLARSSGAVLVEINLASTPLSRMAAFSLRGPAGNILPALAAALNEERT